MISFSLENLEQVNNSHGLSKEEIYDNAEKIKPFLEKIHTRQQGFYKVIDDMDVVTRIKKFAKEKEDKYDDIIVLGIGGSSLGTICLQQTLTHLFENEREGRTQPKLHVIDNIDPILVKSISDIIDLSSTLFIVVTKSGGTPETLSMYFHFRALCDEARLPAPEHFVFVTDPEKGLLRKIATEQNIPTFEVPENVGGRFSVQTAVGLLPAALIGLDIDELLSGFQSMRDKFLSENVDANLPFQLATIQYLLNKKDKNITVLMPYSQKLIKLADWYRQLLAESIGKAQNEAGETVNIGITPINALGATDQHSQSQLYNEGPNDKLFIFIKVHNFGANIPIPNLHPKEESVSFLDDTSFEELMHTELQGTAESYTKNDRPNMTILLKKVDAESLGKLFMLFEGATAFLGEYFEINAFNQPGVELSKNITKELLLKK